MSTTTGTTSSTANLLSSLGAGSGVDTKSLAQSLVDAEKAPRAEAIQTKITKAESRISGYSALMYSASSLKDAFSALNDKTDFNTVSVANSNSSAFSLVAGSAATTGSHEINVLALAKPQRSVSEGFASATTAVSSSALTLNLTVGGVTKNISVAAANSSPNGMVSAINAANLGVKAELVNTGDGSAAPFKIMLTGQTGTTGVFKMSSSNGLNFNTGTRTLSEGVASATTAINGGLPFTLDLNVGGVTQSISIAAGSTNLTGIAAAINNANAGVTAELVNTGDATTPVKMLLTPAAGSSSTVSFSAKQTLSFSAATTALSTGFASGSVALNGGQAFTLNVTDGSSLPTSIAISANSTPDDVVAAVNAASLAGSLGITAALVDSGDGSATPYKIQITSTSGEILTVATDSVVTAPVAGLSSTSSASASLQSASDASLVVNGVTITRTSNTITDAVAGSTLNLLGTTSSAATVNLSRDTSAIKERVRALVAAYNDANSVMNVVTDAKSEVEQFGGALVGDSTVRLVRDQMRAMVTGTSSSPGSTITAMWQLGVNLTREGTLTLDETKLDAALTDNYDEVVTMMTANQSNQSAFTVAPGGVAGDAVKKLSKLISSSGVLMTQTESTDTRISKYKTELEALDARMTLLLARYTKQFAAMDSIVGQSNSLRTNLKGQFEAMASAYSNK